MPYEDYVKQYVNKYRKYQDICAELEELESAAIKQMITHSAGWRKAQVRHEHGNFIARIRRSITGRKFLHITDHTRDYLYDKFSRQ